MSHFTELLIDTYHELLEVTTQLEVIEDLCRSPNNEMRIGFHVSNQKEKLQDRAAAIKKRMKSLGWHRCWKDGDNVEVELP